MMAIETILTEISPLKPVEKLRLVDEILRSLNQTDSQIDEIWAKESEDRIKAYESGKIKAVSADSVFEKYRK